MMIRKGREKMNNLKELVAIMKTEQAKPRMHENVDLDQLALQWHLRAKVWPKKAEPMHSDNVETQVAEQSQTLSSRHMHMYQTPGIMLAEASRTL